MNKQPNSPTNDSAAPIPAWHDQQTTVSQLRKLVDNFIAARHWQPFHTPKNLASSIAIETAELMEHFQWLTPEQSLAVRHDQVAVAEIAEEVADVFAYLLSLCNSLEIDLSSALEAKMRKNAIKYPPPK